MFVTTLILQCTELSGQIYIWLVPPSVISPTAAAVTPLSLLFFSPSGNSYYVMLLSLLLLFLSFRCTHRHAPSSRFSLLRTSSLLRQRQRIHQPWNTSASPRPATRNSHHSYSWSFLSGGPLSDPNHSTQGSGHRSSYEQSRPKWWTITELPK